jgi:hypothetical protein
MASRAQCEHVVGMGIPNEKSWRWNSYAPTGHATGWRRWGMLIFLAVIVLTVLGSLVAGVISLAGWR